MEFKHLIPEDFDHNARVWIYQSDRAFNDKEIAAVKNQLSEFNHKWNSHGSKVLSFADLLFGRFIILMADETSVKVGGCSTDASTRFIKSLEKDYAVSLFDRQTLAFLIDEKIEMIPLENVNTEIENGYITGKTLYFNNTILTKKDLLEKWIIPVKESWLGARIVAQ